MRLQDYKPFSKGRMALILSIYEEAYKFKRLPRTVRGEVHSPEWKKLIYAKKEEMGWGNGEILFLYLLENGSKIVRRGKRTYVRKDRKK
ncbi:MAG: hypothetical protein ACXABY_10560 [Candidatus Thorarchaeota archaeon]|jgi:hypothetical protein